MTGALVPDASAQLRFLQELQLLLDEGQFVSSYKFALLLAIAELSVERDTAADGTLLLPLSDIASRFIELYWRQVAPFRGSEVLRQNIGGQAAVLRKIAAVRTGAGTLAEVQRGSTWKRLLAEVRQLIFVMPLWRLQTVGKEKRLFLYEEALVEDAVLLKPGVSQCFRALHGIVVALVQLSWIRYLQRVPANHSIIGPSGDLAEFLFGSERNALTPLRLHLRDLQHGRCFYCEHTITANGEVDHFIPWSRYPRDLGHNFVLAHAKCNSAKSDLLADVPHLTRWIERNDRDGAALANLFDEKRVLHDKDTTLRVADWAYESTARASGMVWIEGRNMRPLDPDFRRAFG